MKYAAVAATLAGAVVADSWAPVPTTTKSMPVDPATTWDAMYSTTPADPDTWSAVYTTKSVDPDTWVPISATSTTKSQCAYVTEVPVHKCKPGRPDQCWDEKTKTTIYADTCTWSDWYDPATKTEWNTWATYPAVTSTTTGKCSYVTEVPVKKCKPGPPGKPDYCWNGKTKTTVWADSCTWSNMVDSDTTYTWSEVYGTETGTWSNVADVTVTETWSNVDATVTQTWSNVADVSATATWSNVAVVTSVVTPGWSSNGWFGPAWPTASGCNVNVVTSYGAPTWKPTPAAPVSASTWSPIVSVSASTWSPIASVSASTWATYAPAPKGTSPAVPASGNGHAPIAPNGSKWSMTYTPYDSKGQCKTEEVMKADMATLASKGFTSVRVYSTKCNTLQYIGDACRANGLKMILGVFIDKYGVNGDYVKQQVKDIVAWKQWDLVELIVIGNEALYQGFCKAEDLVWLISDCKKQFAAAGYTGYCTTTEPLASWQQAGSQFCAVVDVVSANLYAYFNADTSCDMAGEFIQSEIEILEKICPGKDTYVMESGWPSAGNCNGKACPGKDEQKKAIKSIQDTCGAKIVFFSFEDELWKEAGPYNVEQHWGCADVFDTDSTWKPVTVTSTTASATWASWTTTTSKAVDPTSTWAAY